MALRRQEREKIMRELRLMHYFDGHEHNFILQVGTTLLDTPAGIWLSYRPPNGANPGVVEMLYATRESRHFVAHILGVAAMHSLDTYGQLPIGSDNLSCHSFPIQVRLSNLLGQLPASSTKNFETWFSSIEFHKQWKRTIENANCDFLDINLLKSGLAYTLSILRGTGEGTSLDGTQSVDAQLLCQERLTNHTALTYAENNFSNTRSHTA